MASKPVHPPVQHKSSGNAGAKHGNKVGPANSHSGEKASGGNEHEDKKGDGTAQHGNAKASKAENGEGTGASKSKLSQKTKHDEKMKNGCQKCCGKMMACFAHDAIYGSFIGPHPVSFLFFCSLFKKQCPCTKNCSRPLCVASIATKIMNFLMFGVITLLAVFFVFPWPETLLSTEFAYIAHFYPCQSGKMIKYKEANGGCENHAGYFMAYRCFYAYATLTATHCLLMLRVSNTKDDPYRSRVHHGFWFYKYLYLTALLFVYFFMVNGERDKEGLFEFVASVIGNVVHLFFSLIEITYIMDLVELWVYENKTSKGKWSSFIYRTNTFLVFLVATIIYVKIWVDYSCSRYFVKNDKVVKEWPPWPEDNCIEGIKTYPDWKHLLLILSSTGVIILLIIVMTFRKTLKITVRFPYTGWLQAGVMILFNLTYLWSALTNSSNIHSRPHCNIGLNYFQTPRHRDPRHAIQKGSWDVYFGTSGLFHGLLCILSLLYFAFIHGPRSNVAPLSLLYSFVFRIVDRIPVYPDEDDEEMGLPIGYLQAIEQSKVWDDEQGAVAQSWSLFYFMMTLGSLSLMMAMTNFTNPWAADHYNSSNVAFYCKFGTAVIATGIYIIMLIVECSSIHDYGLREQKTRRRSVREVLEFEFEPSECELDEEGEGHDDKTKRAFQFHLSHMGSEGGKAGRQSEDVNLEAVQAEGRETDAVADGMASSS